MRKWLLKLILGKRYTLNKAVAELYNTISADDILDSWTVGGKVLSGQEIQMIKSEAEYLLKSRLWRVLQADIKYKANKAMYEKAKSELDITAGKLWVWTLDAINTKLKDIIHR